MPARWLTRKEALDYLGISEARFNALVEAELVRAQGAGTGQRFDAETVWAVGVIWDRLEGVLGRESGPASEE